MTMAKTVMYAKSTGAGANARNQRGFQWAARIISLISGKSFDFRLSSLPKELSDIFAQESENDRTFNGFSEHETGDLYKQLSPRGGRLLRYRKTHVFDLYSVESIPTLNFLQNTFRKEAMALG